ncbi:MAG: Kazal-type serine protease inhibitor family protein [Polyangiales bacterium]
MTAHLLRGLFALVLLVGLSSCPGDDDEPTPAPDAGASDGGSSGGSGPRAGAGGTAAGSGGSGRAGSGGTGGVPDVGVGDPGSGGTGGAESGSGGTVAEPAGGSGGEAAAGGASGGSDVDAGREDPVEPPPGSAVCGTRGAVSCPSEQFCQFVPDSSCGADDRGGTCKARPSFCTEQYDPVCGCDGTTYGNACKAASSGISVDRSGECAGGGGRQGGKLVDCDPAKIQCRRAPPQCPQGQVPSIDANGNCYGACVGIESCACSAPAQCPSNPDTYTCHMSGGHCTPYL